MLEKYDVLFTWWLRKRNQIRTNFDDFNADFRDRSKSVQESSPVHLLRNVREFFQVPEAEIHRLGESAHVSVTVRSVHPMMGTESLCVEMKRAI